MRVNVNMTTRPQGEMVEVLHLGMFPNGETSEVDDERAEQWRAATGRDEVPEQLDVTNVVAKNKDIPPHDPNDPVETQPETAPATPQPPAEGVTNA